MPCRCVLMILSTAPEAVPDSRRSQAQPLNADDFRRLLRQLPRPVVIVTSVDFPKTPAEEVDHENRASLGAERPPSASSTAASDRTQPVSRPLLRAMTVSSFSSVAIQPRRLISFSIQRPSRCYDAIRRSGRFNIHVLRSSLEGARLAKYFSEPRRLAPGEPDKGFDPLDLYQNTGTSTTGKWDGTWDQMRGSRSVPDSPERTQTPMGTRDCVPRLCSDGVLYTLRCAMAQSDTAGSGHIHLDQTTILIGEVLDCQPGDSQGCHAKETALMHACQHYHKLGEHFAPERILAVPKPPGVQT